MNMEYYIYIDYSERLVGYIVVEEVKMQNLLPKISKLHHYKDIKHKKSYIHSAKKTFQKNRIEEHLLKCKIKELKDNLSIFVDIIDFIKNHDNHKIFVSVDDNQYTAFMKLLDMIEHRSYVTVVKESDLKKDSAEHRLSLIIDTKLNIERLSK